MVSTFLHHLLAISNRSWIQIPVRGVSDRYHGPLHGRRHGLVHYHGTESSDRWSIPSSGCRKRHTSVLPPPIALWYLPQCHPTRHGSSPVMPGKDTPSITENRRRCRQTGIVYQQRRHVAASKHQQHVPRVDGMVLQPSSAASSVNNFLSCTAL